jgi:hypothetical protein
MSKEKFTTTLSSEILKQLKHYAIDNKTSVNRVIEESIELWLVLKNEKSSFKDILDTFPSNEGSEETRIVRRYIQIQAEQESR